MERVNTGGRRIGSAELARRAGISQSYASRLLRGERKPSAEVLRRVAKAMGVNMDQAAKMVGV